MDNPPSTPQQSPRKEECPDAPKKKNKKSAKEENCECSDNLICNECLDEFKDKDNISRSLF